MLKRQHYYLLVKPTLCLSAPISILLWTMETKNPIKLQILGLNMHYYIFLLDTQYNLFVKYYKI